MTFRLVSLSILSVLVFAACVEMDDTVQTESVLSAVVLEQATGEEFVVELAYSDAVSDEAALVLVNNIDFLDVIQSDAQVFQQGFVDGKVTRLLTADRDFFTF